MGEDTFLLLFLLKDVLTPSTCIFEAFICLEEKATFTLSNSRKTMFANVLNECPSLQTPSSYSLNEYMSQQQAKTHHERHFQAMLQFC